MKHLNYFKSHKAAILLIGVFLPIVMSNGFSFAAASSSSGSSPILQSFNAEKGVYPGMLVAADPKAPGSVEALKSSDVTKMLGVVVPFNSASISLTPASTSSQQVLVAETGKYYVLVSSEGGDITSGENLSMSSLAGVAKKASDLDKTAIGQAGSSFNGKTDVISSVRLKTVSGQVETYSIGSILVNLHLGQNSQYAQSTGGLPQFIIQAAYAIAGKPVSPARIYLSFVIIFAIILTVSTMFYSGTRNGIISIGRNPLSQKSIAKGLTQTTLAGLFVFGIGVALTYAVIVL